jgi:hypothetical protein
VSAISTRQGTMICSSKTRQSSIVATAGIPSVRRRRRTSLARESPWWYPRRYACSVACSCLDRCEELLSSMRVLLLLETMRESDVYNDEVASTAPPAQAVDATRTSGLFGGQRGSDQTHPLFMTLITSEARRSICWAASPSRWSWMSSAPASATSRRPTIQAEGGP